MKPAHRVAWTAGIAVIAGLWTAAALGAWGLLQVGASALEAQSAAATVQAVAAWLERPWVRHWFDPQEADALRDGVDWLLGLGGGPAAWLGWVLALLGAALVLVWAGGLLLGAALLLAARLVARQALAWRRGGPRWPGASDRRRAAGAEAPSPM